MRNDTVSLIMSGEELLYKLRNNFYVGNYLSCVDMRDSIEAVTDEVCSTLCRFYLHRSYIALAKFDEVLNEKSNLIEPILTATRLMAKYLKRDWTNAISPILELQSLSEKFPHEEPIKIILSNVYIHENKLEDAYNVLKEASCLEVYYIRVCLLLSINRHDVAEKNLQSMRMINDYSPLTLVTKSFYYLSTGTQVQDVLGFTQDILSKYSPNSMILNLKACAHICLNQLDQAEACFKQAHNAAECNLEIISPNWFTLCQMLNKPKNVLDSIFEHSICLQDDLKMLSELFDAAL